MKFNPQTTLLAAIFILLAGCGTSRKMATPTTELKKAASSFPRTDPFLRDLLASRPELFGDVMEQMEARAIQVIYTRIDRKKNNKPVFSHFYFNVDPGRYFYPASTVKMPVAFLSLQRLHELGIGGLDRTATMITEKGREDQAPVYNDPSSADGRPTVDQYIKKIFLVSDNEAYNRLYEFLGQEYINRTLLKMGFESTQILHRLSVALDEEGHRHANPVAFYDTAARLLYRQPGSRSALQYAGRSTFLGRGYFRGSELIKEPFDFSRKNRVSLPDLHSMLQSILFPDEVPREMRFRLQEDDYRFLYRQMSLLPRESDFPAYDSTHADGYVKFLMMGGKGKWENESLRIFNKVGDAYGFLTDAAYVVDFEKGVEFLLSATIHCNSDGIYNDDNYEYETVGFPFLKRLGEVIYEYEKSRTRKHRPDLSRFRFENK